MGGKQRATEQKPREQDVSGKKEALTMWLLKFCLNKDKWTLNVARQRWYWQMSAGRRDGNQIRVGRRENRMRGHENWEYRQVFPVNWLWRGMEKRASGWRKSWGGRERANSFWPRTKGTVLKSWLPSRWRYPGCLSNLTQGTGIISYMYFSGLEFRTI